MQRYCFLAILSTGLLWGQKPYDLVTLEVTPEVGILNDLEMGPAGSVLGQRGGQLYQGAVKDGKLEMRVVEGVTGCDGVRGGLPGTAFAQCGDATYWLGSAGNLEKLETGRGRVVWIETDGKEYWVLRGEEEAGLGLQLTFSLGGGAKKVEDEKAAVLERYGRDGAKRGETVIVRARGGEAVIGHFARAGAMVVAGNRSQVWFSKDGGRSFAGCADEAVRRKDRKSGQREDVITALAVNELGVVSVVLHEGEFVRLSGLEACGENQLRPDAKPEVTIPDADVPETVVKVAMDAEGLVFARQSGRWVYWQRGKRWQRAREDGVEAIFRGAGGRVVLVRVQD